MNTARKLAKIVVGTALGVAIWAAVPGSPITTVAGSSLNFSSHVGGSVGTPSGSSLN